MIQPPGPTPNEAARLAELAAYEILDTAAEQAYDDITFLASQICGTPMALVSLVDTHRQWFKSKVGIDATETSREVAFCAHAIHRPSELLVVRDATQDSRFAGNPLVLGDPRVRFYAGAPLITSTGNALGTLCVVDRVPRELSAAQEESLLALSRMVMAQMDLRIARDVAEAADRTKSTFLANMSHEIRTPLNAILGLSELMTIEAFGPLGDDRYGEYAADIHHSGDHLLSLINDILDLSQIEADELKLNETAFDIRETIESVVRMVSLHASDKQVDLATDLPNLPAIRADERRIKQILINLITNAIKFTPAGGRVSVRTLVAGNGGVSIEVADTGIGMSESEIETALTAFGQIENDVATQAGSGLGLPITKRLIEAHGGRFELLSTPGEGTTAVVHLPPPHDARLAA